MGITPVTFQLPPGTYLLEAEGPDVSRGTRLLEMHDMPKRLVVDTGSEGLGTAGTLLTAVGIVAILAGIVMPIGGATGKESDLKRTETIVPVLDRRRSGARRRDRDFTFCPAPGRRRAFRRISRVRRRNARSWADSGFDSDRQRATRPLPYFEARNSRHCRPIHCMSCEVQSSLPRAGRSCSGLAAPSLCAACDERKPYRGPFCAVCASGSLSVLSCRIGGGVPLWAAGTYASPLSDAIRRFKYESRPDLARPLSRLVTPALSRLAPVPGSCWYRYRCIPAASPSEVTIRRRCSRRSLHGTAALAALPVRSCGRGTRRRKSVGRERTDIAGVAGVFAVREGVLLRGRKVILVDDVATTGSTLRACIRSSRPPERSPGRAGARPSHRGRIRPLKRESSSDWAAEREIVDSRSDAAFAERPVK